MISEHGIYTREREEEIIKAEWVRGIYKNMWIEQFKKYRHLTELDRECIVHLIEKILIYDGKRIEVCFRYRDELENALQYIERFEDVLPAEEGVTIPERRNA